MSAQHTLARRRVLAGAVTSAHEALDAFDLAWAAEHGLVEGAIVRTNESGAHDGRRIRIERVGIVVYRTGPDVLIQAEGHVLRKSDGATGRAMGTHTIRLAAVNDTGGQS